MARSKIKRKISEEDRVVIVHYLKIDGNWDMTICRKKDAHSIENKMLKSGKAIKTDTPSLRFPENK